MLSNVGQVAHLAAVAAVLWVGVDVGLTARSGGVAVAEAGRAVANAHATSTEFIHHVGGTTFSATGSAVVFVVEQVSLAAVGIIVVAVSISSATLACAAHTLLVLLAAAGAAGASPLGLAAVGGVAIAVAAPIDASADAALAGHTRLHRNKRQVADAAASPAVAGVNQSVGAPGSTKRLALCKRV